jgi:hypothetical protein
MRLLILLALARIPISAWSSMPARQARRRATRREQLAGLHLTALSGGRASARFAQ